MTKLVDAVLRGEFPYFGIDGVLYVPGQIVPDVPEEEVSDEEHRQETVKVEGLDGKLRDRQVQRQVRFRPISDAQREAFRAKGARDRAMSDEQHTGPKTGFMAGS